jgi:hypothetical protein
LGRRDGRTPKEIARALGLKPAEVAPLIRAVGAAAPRREAELVGCWITDDWSERLTVHGHPEWPGVQAAGDVEAGGLVGVLVAREHGSSVSACGYLVDAWSLGVKNCMGPTTMDRRKLPDFVSFFFRSLSRPPTPAPLDLARHMVFGAVDYARGLGFEPHPDFAECAGHLGEWDGPGDITFGRRRQFPLRQPDRLTVCQRRAAQRLGLAGLGPARIRRSARTGRAGQVRGTGGQGHGDQPQPAGSADFTGQHRRRSLTRGGLRRR